MKPFKNYLKEILDNKLIQKGLIASYDTEKLANRIMDIIRDKVNATDLPQLPQSLKTTSYGQIFTINIGLTEPLNDEEKEKLDKLLSIFGYTNATKYTDDMVLQIEPKYPVLINNMIESSNDLGLYHITQNKYLNKIKSIGLIPKISQTTFEHPGNRIYLLWLPHTPKIDKKYLLGSFKKILANNKKIKPEDMCIIKITYDAGDKYYIDDTTTIIGRGLFGVFTTNNISPDRIQEII